MREEINTIEDEAEIYFIHFVFTRNKDLFKKNYRKLYDVLFDKYLKVYKLGREQKLDLLDIDNRFLNDLTKK